MTKAEKFAVSVLVVTLWLTLVFFTLTISESPGWQQCRKDLGNWECLTNGSFARKM